MPGFDNVMILGYWSMEYNCLQYIDCWVMFHFQYGEGSPVFWPRLVQWFAFYRPCTTWYVIHIHVLYTHVHVHVHVIEVYMYIPYSQKRSWMKTLTNWRQYSISREKLMVYI